MSEEQDISLVILRYLNNRPAAADTCEGIAAWWLRKEWAERRIASVQVAVRGLVEQGLLLEDKSVGICTPLYRLNPDQRETIQNMLRVSDPDSI